MASLKPCFVYIRVVTPNSYGDQMGDIHELCDKDLRTGEYMSHLREWPLLSSSSLVCTWRQGPNTARSLHLIKEARNSEFKKGNVDNL